MEITTRWLTTGSFILLYSAALDWVERGSAARRGSSNSAFHQRVILRPPQLFALLATSVDRIRLHFDVRGPRSPIRSYRDNAHPDHDQCPAVASVLLATWVLVFAKVLSSRQRTNPWRD
jgi:hypothetical protein